MIAKHVQHKGAKLLAVQADIVRTKWGGIDQHPDFVFYYPDHIDVNSKQLWGGYSPDVELKVLIGMCAN